MTDDSEIPSPQGAPRRRASPRVSGRAAGATRDRLIDAALDAFGRYGFDAASTREIARLAGTNLAAIPYHFGGKEGLHIAVARHIADEVHGRLGGVVDQAEAALSAGTIDPPAARVMLHALLDSGAAMILGHPEAARWAPFIIREQAQPSAAFDVIYDGFMGRAHVVATRLFAIATGRPAEAEATIVRVLGLFGQLIVFRMARALVERRLGWTDYGPGEIALVTAMLHEHLDAMLDAQREAEAKR
ncbi:TetR family transcriptional regulator [Tepidamorphus gemmatus]|uniref:TetR family transcriptional regulator n=1 Tax=Tepidamorphus gemmatus TaxID=747076 RepID=A0A4R3MEW8_9HYPH|nr:CerR family C-terminal domain-containing protein [Tepidamorphus gemmatus]TCT12041.1 TetR family transcriptional regulator [Tepidamorphus gemmatus]